ncbi:hypothetical protein HG536_0C01110 [Torulaspora globosa]|uniref:Pre-mRNA-splicing factor CWC15 n=1 Tax=Torulaspora globosa TaxID=48254 RepID=A0A7G3ZEK8_9SACH|nr:uncharacterized protein HG536_0C01110 [Torulaspora globosa]QLL31944.1 hypothetical protein HG536_0C01110 [Torulaspora globosa]
MTTSHRPQLEARSGAKGASYVPTGTQHARLLPGHTKLKLRNKKADRNAEVGGELSEAKTDEVDSSEDGSVNEPAEEAEEDEEEDDDQEALLQELNKIRQERRGAKINDKGEPMVKIEDGLSQLTPVPSSGRSWRKSTTFGRNRVHKASNTQGADNGADYQNDLLKSKYHQDFMRRYVK